MTSAAARRRGRAAGRAPAEQRRLERAADVHDRHAPHAESRRDRREHAVVEGQGVAADRRAVIEQREMIRAPGAPPERPVPERVEIEGRLGEGAQVEQVGRKDDRERASAAGRSGSARMRALTRDPSPQERLGLVQCRGRSDLVEAVRDLEGAKCPCAASARSRLRDHRVHRRRTRSPRSEEAVVDPLGVRRRGSLVVCGHQAFPHDRVRRRERPAFRRTDIDPGAPARDGPRRSAGSRRGDRCRRRGRGTVAEQRQAHRGSHRPYRATRVLVGVRDPEPEPIPLPMVCSISSPRWPTAITTRSRRARAAAPADARGRAGPRPARCLREIAGHCPRRVPSPPARTTPAGRSAAGVTVEDRSGSPTALVVPGRRDFALEALHGLDDEHRPALHLVVDAADVLAHHSQTQQLDSGEERDQHDERRVAPVDLVAGQTQHEVGGADRHRDQEREQANQ